MTTSDVGAAVAFSAPRLVQNGVSARPSIGGTAAVVPVLSTTPRDATTRSTPSFVSTSTVRFPASRPWPRMKRMPASSRRSTATVSSQLSVATSRMRFATGAKSGATSA
jgi:hypothetical protein